MANWITLYPQWYVRERNEIARRYPSFRVDETLLRHGALCYYGELIARPTTGSQRFPVRLSYPDGTPFEFPVVTPVEQLPTYDADGGVNLSPKARLFDRRHQMPSGGLCLFQRDTRGAQGGETIRGVDVLARAERWFTGHLTGRWPPDSHESELEPHFPYAGDVLLGQIFYSPEITGYGRFFMIRDMERVFVDRDTNDPPLIMSVITVGGVEAVYDARANLEKIFPWLSNDAWDPQKLTELEQKQNSEDVFGLFSEHGHWWKLPNEPMPFRNGAGLLNELTSVAPNGDAWAMISAALGSDLAVRSRHYFGLRYPGRNGVDEWLIVIVQTPEKRKTASGGIMLGQSEEQKRSEFSAGRVGCLFVHSIRQADLHLRNTSVVSNGLENKRVAIIGLGALGARVAELLAQAGVSNFRLCDNDVLKTGNVARHIGGLSDFGSRKTRVVATRLYDINPQVTVNVTNDSAVASMRRLIAFLDGVDVVVCTTADENTESAINQIAVLKRRTVVYGRAMRRGSVGRVFIVRPGVDACKACLGQYASGHSDGVLDPPKWMHVSERSEDILLHECGRPVIPASAVDLSLVSSFVARKALDVIEDKTELSNHLLWSRDTAVDIDAAFGHPFVTLESTFKPLPGCQACQEPDVSRIQISKQIEEFMRNHVEASPKAETGGILIGYIMNRKAIVVRATGPGPKSKRSPHLFERDVEFVQQELDRAAQELGERGLYIGEWHSHLVASPSPSSQDIESLCGIAQSPNYATRCPVMIIAGLDTEKCEVVKLRCWTFPVSGRVYEARLEILGNGQLDVKR